jgi:hypothetical protein
MNTIERGQLDDGPIDDAAVSRPSHQSDQLSHERKRRRRRITVGSINAACDEFFRSRGMLKGASALVWQRSQQGSKLSLLTDAANPDKENDAPN